MTTETSTRGGSGTGSLLACPDHRGRRVIQAVRRVFASRDLLVTLTERHFRLRLKRSWMGIVWPTTFPFVLAFLYLYLFKNVLDVPIPRYTDYLLCGLIPWVFFQQAAIRG